MGELKPCPFCGGTAEILRVGSARASMQIGCSFCGAFMESGDVVGLTKPEDYRWNRRVIPSPPDLAADAGEVCQCMKPWPIRRRENQSPSCNNCGKPLRTSAPEEAK